MMSPLFFSTVCIVHIARWCATERSICKTQEKNLSGQSQAGQEMGRQAGQPRHCQPPTYDDYLSVNPESVIVKYRPSGGVNLIKLLLSPNIQSFSVLKDKVLSNN